MPSKGSNPAITLATLLLVFVAGAGLPGLTSSSHYSVYFDRDDPSRLNHEAIQLEYGRGDSLIVLLDSKEGTFLDAERWFLLEDLADGLRQLPDVSVVIAASELNIGGVIETPSGQLIPDRDALADHGRVFGLLLSDDATLAAVAVDIPLTDHRAQTALARNAAVREVVDRFTRDSPVEASYTGTLAMSAAYVDVVRSDLRVIMPMLLVTMFVLLGALLGGWRAIGAALPIGLLAVASAFGIAGWLSAELAAINTFAPIMILSIGTAGCVHLLLHYQRLRAGGAPPSEAAVRARRQVMLPMSIANATTILGFLALLLSPSPPLRIVGYTVAAGVSVSWLLCVTLMPAMLARLDPRGATALGMYPTLRSLVGFVTRRNTAILVGAAAIGIIAAALVTQNRVSDSVLSYFPGSQPFTAATETADRKLAGVTELLIDLDAGEPSALLSESQVRAVADYVAWLRDQPETVRVSSLLDSEVLRAAIDAQRLEALLSRAADRTVGQLERREVNAERSRMLIAVHLEPLASGEIIEFEARARAAAIGLIPGLDITTGGTNLIFAKLGETNIRSMMLALSFGLLFAAVLFGVVLRSATVALIGLACNVLPVITVYGVWALLNGNLSLGAATVMGMILGIVIDDTVYLLTAWWRQRQEADAVARAVAEVGPALVTTSLVLALGLSAGLLSDFLPVWSMSALSVGIILTALAIDLVALPAMLIRRTSHA